ncbi:iron-sulfur cluster-binding protein [Nocardioides donggukensis]|uniref:Dihydroorotate dehydrogenase electron transfer subunit n=1 Tax=Nocardioides donggukensis TaxID=2774019 RepID=A0A927K3I5_9ACTN|nr:dihydroorotate dehydrogenase electron transfer subunit [Nocardioides donggukensis]MBD8869739.1 dihydroorotate dehydrogenase electron transfer subunit [Nocardioides donggukensis]
MSPDRGPLHVAGEVLSVKRIGAHHHVTVVAPGIAERFRPGTFVVLTLDDAADTARLQPRSFWIHRVRPTGSHGATIELVVAAGSRFTRRLVALPQGSPVRVTGPLGRPFAQPREPVSCLLVGEGYAAAPLFPLAERLRERGCTVSVLLAAPDEAHLLGALEARRTARSVTVVTADGSVGVRGTVVDALPELLTRSAADVVYAAGPVATLHAAAAAAEQHGAWSQTALETAQPCGTGLCQGCPVPVVAEDGVGRLVRACTDGPVFRGDRVRWLEVDAR